MSNQYSTLYVPLTKLIRQSDDEGLVMIVTPDQWEFSVFPVVGAVDTVSFKPSLSSVHVYPLRCVKVNVSGCECVALEDSGCQIPVVSKRMFEWCCGDAVGKVALRGFGKSHTVQAPLVNLTVRVCDDERVEAVEIPLVCAVTDLCGVAHGSTPRVTQRPQAWLSGLTSPVRTC